jgi:hypothetical protein
MKTVFEVEFFNHIRLMTVERFFVFTGYFRHTINRTLGE